MSKTFNFAEKSTIKNNAKAVAFYRGLQSKLDKKIEALQRERDGYEQMIQDYNNQTIKITGYTPEDLCELVVRGSNKTWAFKYPDTIVPPQEDVQQEVEHDEDTQLDPLPEEINIPTVQTSEETVEEPDFEEGDSTYQEQEEIIEEEKEEEMQNGNDDDPDFF